ncbi:hypothetical protein MHC_04835 [Mycoplasma haemocanis str. Illinois]|uniref:Uncharacterized protein n=1 Tax=Mycoplasma haemocanis (strain Illinois) TaxID=1111676 RepID=H6N851_MYCHN|nr:hypothetical protein [Mycoplasma haemocanis]AEW45823.1 hypothetical protein MHC_04835 [Mycoplasma haemocanis str. Illinois]
MSRGRILLGIGGAGVTTLAALFGTSQIKERNYQTKMRKFRETAKKVNGYLSKHGWGDTKLYDPEHVMWDKKFRYLESTGWTDPRFTYLPKEAKNSPDDFKNFCFETLELNAEDVVKGDGLNPSDIHPTKGYWDYCSENGTGFKQLMEGQ